MRLDGRTALVTGGTQGVGAAIAIRLAKARCNVILHGLGEDAASRDTLSACEAEGVMANCIFTDLAVSPEESIPSVLQQVDALASDVTILINNAGTFCDKPFLDMDFTTYQHTMQLNVAAGYFLTQAFARRWIAAGAAGRVLFTGSINGELAEPNHSAYDTSKGAVRTMVRSLCVALAPHQIRVNAMAPGLVVTPLTAPALLEDPDAMSWMQLHTPNGQVPGPEACAEAALFLVSDEATHIHGQTLTVDGGMSAWQQPDLPARLRGHI